MSKDASRPRELFHTKEFWHEGALWVEEARRYVKAKVVEYPEGCWTVMRPGYSPVMFDDAEKAKNFAEDDS